MSLTSLYTAVSGMNVMDSYLAVIGDNIANMNTVGFKGSRLSFGDILTQSISGGSGGNIGRGVQITSGDPLFSQGSFINTSNPLDLAIDGDGFFILQDDANALYYTRNGEFELDEDGYIIDSTGLRLQGYSFNTDFSTFFSSSLDDIQLTNALTGARSTTEYDLSVNLNSESTDVSAIDLDGDGTNDLNYSFSSTLVVYDSQGTSHDITVYFERITGTNSWTVHYVQGSAPNAYTEVGQDSLTFDTSGNLLTATSNAIPFSFGSTVASQTVSFDFSNATQYASSFSTQDLAQNGQAAGSLASLTISEDGSVTGIFTNGLEQDIAQIALARFNAPQELTKLGSNLYGESADSGDPIRGAPDTGGLGRIISNSLELSNVDLSEQFIQMISAQRSFQANTRLITTTDDLLQEVINTKR